MTFLKTILVGAFLIVTTVGLAAETLPEPLTNDEMDALIKKADDVYESGKYDAAYKIYRHELAPRGDAFGQYFTGFMLLHGQGVEADPVRSAAWMQLAADQGHLTLIRAAKKARKALDEPQQLQLDAAYAELKKNFGDCALLAARIEYLDQHVAAITGSRVAENVSRVTVLYQFGPDLGFQQRQMQLREIVKKQRKAYRRECR